MPKISVGLAMTLLIIGNMIAVFSDALIKTLSADGAVYQFVFFRQLSAVLILLPFCLFSKKKWPVRWSKVARPTRPHLVIWRYIYGYSPQRYAISHR